MPFVTKLGPGDSQSPQIRNISLSSLNVDITLGNVAVAVAFEVSDDVSGVSYCEVRLALLGSADAFTWYGHVFNGFVDMSIYLSDLSLSLCLSI